MQRATLASSSTAEIMITGTCSWTGLGLELLEHGNAVQLWHDDVEQNDVRGGLAQALQRLLAVLGRPRVMALLLEEAHEQLPIQAHRRRRRGSTPAPGSRGSAYAESRQRRLDPNVLGLGLPDELVAGGELPGLRLLLELTAELREALGAEGGAVGLQRVGSPSSLIGVPSFERAPKGCELGGGVTEERGDELADELLADRFPQAVECRPVQDGGRPGAHVPAPARPLSGRARPSAAASSSGRIGFAT